MIPSTSLSATATMATKPLPAARAEAKWTWLLTLPADRSLALILGLHGQLEGMELHCTTPIVDNDDKMVDSSDDADDEIMDYCEGYPSQMSVSAPSSTEKKEKIKSGRRE